MRKDFAVRAHDLPGQNDLTTLANNLNERGLQTLAFAPALTLSELTQGGDAVSVGLANYTRRTLADHHIEIGTLSCYVNLIDPDRNKRRTVVERFKRYLQLAPNFGTRIVASETGSVDPNFAFTKENFGQPAFQVLLDSLTELLTAAHHAGTWIALEPGVNHPLCSLDRTEEMIKYFKYDTSIKLIIDPVNLILPEKDNVYEILEDAFRRFGNRIVGVHLKDYEWTPNAPRLLKTVVPGTGHVDLSQLINIAEKHQPFGMKFLDELPGEKLDQTLKLPLLATYK